MEKEWRDVPGYSGTYKVSNNGEVYSKNKGRNLKNNVSNRGYERVTLDSQQKSVHRIVCEAFIEKQIGKDVVNHKNGIKTDNRVSNLEWVTPRGNSKHYYSDKIVKAIQLKTCVRYEKWIVVNGKNRRLGRFKTREEAKIAYEEFLFKNNLL